MTTVQASSSTHRSAMPGWPSGLDNLSGAGGVQFSRHERVIRRATELSTSGLRREVADAYADLFLTAVATASPHPVRFWNYLPSIHQPMGDGLDRYMVFNAGRLDGFERATGPVDTQTGPVATASAVGHDGDDLLIHCLCADHPGRPVANPRQVEPVRYSARYGPRPPCFSRATAVTAAGANSWLFVGGTASIRGEASLHRRQLPQQLDETLINLSAVVSAAGGSPGDDPLARLVALRVYYPSTDDARPLRAAVTPRFPNVDHIEFVLARLCRAELLVEIEGVAEL